uniref:Uncharacterized protein n=1 Tax=viral metagenome TaxID=1070528 RepID=A0A6C0H783_9ZZZZ
MNSNILQYASLLPTDDDNSNNPKKNKKNINKINTMLNKIHEENNDLNSSSSDEEEIDLKKPIRKKNVDAFTNYHKNNQYVSTLLDSSPYSLNKITQSSPIPPINNESINYNSSENIIENKLNYLIHLLEESKDEKTGHVIEEVVLYSFLGIFIIFIVDSFSKMGKYTR